MIRADEYRVGDKVQFNPPDEYGYSPCNIPHGHAATHGPGPYTIEDIKAAKANFHGVGHTQFVRINGELYSGAWFQAIRR